MIFQAMWGYNKKMLLCKTKKSVLMDTRSATTLFSDFPAYRGQMFAV